MTSACPTPMGGLTGRDLGDEYLFYDHECDRVHVLNGTAREIFLLCDGSRSEEELVHRLVERFHVDETTARRDVSETVRRLIDLKVLQLI